MRLRLPLLLLLLLCCFAKASSAKAPPLGYAYEFLAGAYADVAFDPGELWMDQTRFTYSFWMNAYNTRSGAKQGVIGPTQFYDGPLPLMRYLNSGVFILEDNSLRLCAGVDFRARAPMVPFEAYERRWVHVAATFDSAVGNGTGALFLDGVLRSAVSDLGPCTTATIPFRVGSSRQNDNFNGMLDEIAVFNRALTAEEVSALWNRTLRGDEAGLQLLLVADGDPHGSLVDRSPHARNSQLYLGDGFEFARNRSYFRADCERVDEGEGRCLPSKEFTCGDGLVLGISEECDGGDGCDDNCSCVSGFAPVGLPCCARIAAPTCDYSSVLAHCASYSCTTCECAEESTVRCMLDRGCNMEKMASDLAMFWESCVSVCAANVSVCMQLVPETCQAHFEQANCEAAGCFWCSEAKACTTLSSDCQPHCGDGILRKDFEACDDGNTAEGDGCSSSCGVNNGWVCAEAGGAGSCAPLCGDGILVSGEACDDGALVDGDGCNSTCAVERGWVCPIASTCYPFCGDQLIRGDEACDDGNTQDGDGCSSSCSVEKGWTCTGEPSVCRKDISDGELAALIVCSVLCFAALVGIVALAIGTKPKKRHTTISHSQSVGMLSEFVVLECTGDGQDLDISHSKFLSQASFPLGIEPIELAFGTRPGSRLAVDSIVEMPLTLLCKTLPVAHWKISCHQESKFCLSFDPSQGTLQMGESVSITARLIVHCTTELRFDIPIAVKEDDESSEMSHTFLPMNVSTALSTRLDPDHLRITLPPIGEGSYGTVFLGVYKTQRVAVKLLKNQQGLSSTAVKELTREMQALQDLRSPYIVQFLGGVLFPGQMCIVTEFIDLGSLSKLLRGGKLPLSLRMRMCLDACRGMRFLHTNRFMHRDLKTENLLVTSLNESDAVVCKLSDLGSTREVSEEQSAKYTAYIGTPLYMAPEMLAHGEQYSMAADVYSFGIVLHESYTMQEPFSTFDFKQPWHLARHVTQGGRMPIPAACPQRLSELIKRCWDGDPSARPSFTEGLLQDMESIYSSVASSHLSTSSSSDHSISFSTPSLSIRGTCSTPAVLEDCISLDTYFHEQERAALQHQLAHPQSHTVAAPQHMHSARDGSSGLQVAETF